MKELSLNILDIAENSVKAQAELTEILIDETNDRMIITISDNGCGMSKETLAGVTDPFYTTRTTRNVGLGIPLLKLAAEQAGGNLTIDSRSSDEFPDSHGTVVTASFDKNNIDFTPLGDIISTVTTLIQGHPDYNFLFIHKTPDGKAEIDTREIKSVLEGVPIDTYEVIKWIEDNLKEQYNEMSFYRADN